jgi:hypothetical protein
LNAPNARDEIFGVDSNGTDRQTENGNIGSTQETASERMEAAEGAGRGVITNGTEEQQDEETNAPNDIKVFGEKIGGSRKDKAKARAKETIRDLADEEIAPIQEAFDNLFDTIETTQTERDKWSTANRRWNGKWNGEVLVLIKTAALSTMPTTGRWKP